MNVVDQMKIEVMNESVAGKKKHVGSGRIKLREAIPQKNTTTFFTVPLIYKKVKSGSLAPQETLRGTANFTAEIVDRRGLLYECGCPVS